MELFLLELKGKKYDSHKWLWCSFIITMANFFLITFISKCLVVVNNCSTYVYVLCDSGCIQYNYCQNAFLTCSCVLHHYVIYSYTDMYNPITLVLHSQFWMLIQSQALVFILHLLYKKKCLNRLPLGKTQSYWSSYMSFTVSLHHQSTTSTWFLNLNLIATAS